MAIRHSRSGLTGGDFAVLENSIFDIRARIVKAAGGEAGLKKELPFLFRQAFDELVDTPRTRRFRFSELDPNEKAVLGIKVEAALRQLLDFPRGKLDFRIGPHDVDVKFTSGNNWMIPPEAIGHACILTKADPVSSRFSFGLAIASDSNLTKGENRDRKRSFSSAGRANVHWIAFEEPFPPNLWESIPAEQAAKIFEPNGGTDRVVRLFEYFLGKPIHRSIIQAVGQQLDPMKRIRKAGGARDHLHPRGIVVLSGTQDGPLLRSLKIELGREFVMADPAP
ncbi:MAG: hypothetical protein CMH94_08455 [Oceanicaulis sp.]|nr:hypothetical protein [Maricaulis sp.]MBI75617.1 hypothetical protein [Oceanicaulis sp.]